MSRLLKSSASFTFLALLSTGALAADLPSSTKDGGSHYATESGRAANLFAGWYVGVQGGGQFTNIDVIDQFDGIGADGLIGGIHAGYNLSLGRLVTGPYVEGSLSNVNVDLAGQDLLVQDWYVQGGWLVGVNVSPSTLLSAHLGYEWAKWSSDLYDEEADVRSFAIGGGIDTIVASHVTFGVKLDYLIPHSIEVDSHDVTDFLDASESLRVMGRLTYRQ